MDFTQCLTQTHSEGNKKRSLALAHTQLVQTKFNMGTNMGLPPPTFAWTVSSELLGFYCIFPYFSFLGRALD